MSPLIERRIGKGPDQVKTVIADLPDETGVYDTLLGQITIDLSKLVSPNPNSSLNIIVLEGEREILGGRDQDSTRVRREVEVSWKGTATVQTGPNEYLDITMRRRLRSNPSHYKRRWMSRSDYRTYGW